jgi:hypothetical protein
MSLDLPALEAELVAKAELIKAALPKIQTIVTDIQSVATDVEPVLALLPLPASAKSGLTDAEVALADLQQVLTWAQVFVSKI